MTDKNNTIVNKPKNKPKTSRNQKTTYKRPQNQTQQPKAQITYNCRTKVLKVHK